MDGLPPAQGGLLDLRVPWTTLTGQSPEPGYLGRLGPISPGQAAHLTELAARDPAARWRAILTDHEGKATAVTRLTAPAQARRTATASPAGLVGQVTVTIGPDYLTEPADTADLPPALSQVLAAARSTAAKTAQQAEAGTQRDNCAHTEATPAYRPATRLWDYIITRDLTCRFPTCRQPAIRCDLDHTTPFEKGGVTCCCNLGAICRYHHGKIKQHPGWHLNQPAPGTFTWTTPTGRTYTIEPDTHAA